MLVGPGPLDLHRLAGPVVRDQRRVERRVVRAVVAVAAGSVHVPNRDRVGRQVERLGDRRPEELDALAVAPDIEPLAVEEGHPAGWPDRAVQQERLGVADRDHRRGRVVGPRRAWLVVGHRAVHHERRRLDRGDHPVGIGRRNSCCGRLAPAEPLTDRLGSKHGVALPVGDDGDEAAIDHDVDREPEDALHLRSQGRRIDRLGEMVLDPTRAYDAGVAHRTGVVDEDGFAADLRGQVDPAQADPGPGPLARRQRRHRALDGHPEARLTDELPVRHRTPVERSHPPIAARQIAGLDAQAIGCTREERSAGVGTRLPHRHRALLDGPAAGRDELVWRCPGGGALDIDEARVDAELIGRHRDDRRADPLAELGLARPDDDAAVAEGEPSIELRRPRQAPQCGVTHHRLRAPHRRRPGCAGARRNGTGVRRGPVRPPRGSVRPTARRGR